MKFQSIFRHAHGIASTHQKLHRKIGYQRKYLQFRMTARDFPPFFSCTKSAHTRTGKIQISFADPNKFSREQMPEKDDLFFFYIFFKGARVCFHFIPPLFFRGRIGRCRLCGECDLFRLGRKTNGVVKNARSSRRSSFHKCDVNIFRNLSVSAWHVMLKA